MSTRLCALVVSCMAMSCVVRGQDKPPRFAEAIAAFEKADREQAPPRDAIVFVGSSSFRGWKTLAEDMAPLPVINRGFGGSAFPDLLRYTDRIVLPYAPRIIVVYEGDNDLAGKNTRAETVVANFRRFVETVQAKLSRTQVFFLAIKPSGRRFARWPEMQKANQSIREYAAGTPRVGYIDIAHTLLDDTGRPIDARFRKDRLHVTRDTYRRWAEVIRPVLLKAYENADPSAKD